MFFEAASEERQHAIKLIEYLLMRGELLNDLRPVIENVPVSVRFFKIILCHKEITLRINVFGIFRNH